MGFNFDSGEAMGDINDIFFKKDGKSILPQATTNNDSEKVSPAEIAKQMAETIENARKEGNVGTGKTIIHISKDVIGGEEDVSYVLTQLEEKRRNTSTIRNKHFIDIDTGEEIRIIDHNEMYNGTNLFTVKHMSNGKVITYPRSMFVGREKKFVPKEYYIREAERAIEDSIDKYGQSILEIIKDPTRLEETSDGKYLELVLDEPIDIIGGIIVPDKIQIPIKRMFDMEYKLLMLECVICLDSKIAALLFIDIWF